LHFTILVFRADSRVDTSSHGCYDERRSTFVSQTHDQKQRFPQNEVRLFAASIQCVGDGVFETARRAPVAWDDGRRCTVTDTLIVTSKAKRLDTVLHPWSREI
jgi:hypothetical protein